MEEYVGEFVALVLALLVGVGGSAVIVETGAGSVGWLRELLAGPRHTRLLSVASALGRPRQDLRIRQRHPHDATGLRQE